MTDTPRGKRIAELACELDREALAGLIAEMETDQRNELGHSLIDRAAGWTDAEIGERIAESRYIAQILTFILAQRITNDVDTITGETAP